MSARRASNSAWRFCLVESDLASSSFVASRAASSPLRQAIEISTGLASRPVNVTAAKISADIRAGLSMAKLGGATISSLSDLPVSAVSSMFRGSGFWQGLFRQVDGILKGRPKGEQAEISYLLGEGFDGMIGHIVSPTAANDSPVGKLSALQEKYFRWNGLSWWTDVNRATAGRVYVAALPAIRFDADMRAFFTRLKQQGKPGKVALVAVMRKMIIILNAKMRDANATVLDT